MVQYNVVYLIHFHQRIGNISSKYGTAGHYLGYARNLEDRLERHRSGQGSHLMRAVKEAGISWEVIRVWKGNRRFERKLKNQKNSCRLCPICSKSRKKK